MFVLVYADFLIIYEYSSTWPYVKGDNVFFFFFVRTYKDISPFSFVKFEI